MRPARHAERGQAIVETLLFLPLFLLALFGTIWAAQVAVQHERVENALRYFANVSEQADPYAKWSYSSMYGQLGNATLPTILCTPPIADALSDASPTYSTSHVGNTTVSPPFWTPSSAAGGCTSARVWGMQQNPAAQQQNNMDMLFITKTPSVSSTVPVPSQLVSVLGVSSLASSSEVVYDQIGLNVLLACYPDFNTLLTSSLSYATDASAATTPIAVSSADLFNADEGKFDYFPVSASCL